MNKCVHQQWRQEELLVEQLRKAPTSIRDVTSRDIDVVNIAESIGLGKGALNRYTFTCCQILARACLTSSLFNSASVTESSSLHFPFRDLFFLLLEWPLGCLTVSGSCPMSSSLNINFFFTPSKQPSSSSFSCSIPALNQALHVDSSSRCCMLIFFPY